MTIFKDWLSHNFCQELCCIVVYVWPDSFACCQVFINAQSGNKKNSVLYFIYSPHVFSTDCVGGALLPSEEHCPQRLEGEAEIYCCSYMQI